MAGQRKWVDDYEKLFELVKKETNEDPNNIAKMNIKKNFFITNKANKTYEVPLNKFDEAVRSHCHDCDEFTSRFADISFGGNVCGSATRTSASNVCADSLRHGPCLGLADGAAACLGAYSTRPRHR